MPRRLVLPGILAIAMIASACTGSSAGSPGASTTPAPRSATPSAVSPLPSEGALAAHPPACVEGLFFQDPTERRLLLASCVDQEHGQGAEGIWAWDGTAWKLVDEGGPGPTVVTGVAYDTARRTLVRYGGLPMTSNDCVRETWEWDRADWRRIEASGPTVCDHLKLSYDAGKGVTLLFSGGDEHQALIAETWSWDGSRWVRLAGSGPSGRAHFGLVYDDAHHQTLLYGGFDGDLVFDDFWSWDGAAWHKLPVTGPGPRSHSGMAISPDGLLLFGGATGPSSFTTLTNDTWYLTGGRWSKREGPAPSPRGSPALGYDSQRRVMVLYGGFGPDGASLGDTWEWDGSWHCVDACR